MKMSFDFSAQNLFDVFPEAERYPNNFRKSYKSPSDVSVAKMGDVYLADISQVGWVERPRDNLDGCCNACWP
jgi:hypothetical protein